MAKTIAEFTIREVEEDGKCKVQYITKGKVLYEGKAYPRGKYGHPYYCDMVKDSLARLQQ